MNVSDLGLWKGYSYLSTCLSCDCHREGHLISGDLLLKNLIVVSLNKISEISDGCSDKGTPSEDPDQKKNAAR